MRQEQEVVTLTMVVTRWMKILFCRDKEGCYVSKACADLFINKEGRNVFKEDVQHENHNNPGLRAPI